MPYPLVSDPPQFGDRVRILPPEGCPGRSQWVLPHDVNGWLKLGFREAPVPQLDLELAWMPSPRRWDEPALTRAVTLLIDPRAVAPQSIHIDWGDGTPQEVVPWSPYDRTLPEPRHTYSQIADVMVTVQIGMLVSNLQVALLGCPVPVTGPAPMEQPTVGQGFPLVPGAGLMGNAFDGTRTEQWQLRLHPEGGLAMLPSPIDGQPALTVMYGAGAASRGTRWYSGDGPPTPEWTAMVQPPPAPGDFYLDRLTGNVYELTA